MYISNNDINLSGFSKTSEKEPTTVLENLTQKFRDEKEPDSINQKSLEKIRSKDTVRELFESQNKDNVVNEHHYGDKGTNETQLNNSKDQRNDEYYSSGLSLFTREVFPKIRERRKKNEQFYNMPENKKRVGNGDVVSANKKSEIISKSKKVRVVKAQSDEIWFRRFENLHKIVDRAQKAWEDGNDSLCKSRLSLMRGKLETYETELGENMDDRAYRESPGAKREDMEQYQLNNPEKFELENLSSAKKVRVVKAQYAVETLPEQQPSDLIATQTPVHEIQQSLQQQPPQQTEQSISNNQPQRHQERQHGQDLNKQQGEQSKDQHGPKKHSLKYWNHITKEWKTIAEHDDSKELEKMKEEAIQEYYKGSEFKGKNAPFEIFVNEHVKK